MLPKYWNGLIAIASAQKPQSAYLQRLACVTKITGQRADNHCSVQRP
jgi:hypothetical protein